LCGQAEGKPFFDAAMPEGVKVKPYGICVGKLKVISALKSSLICGKEECKIFLDAVKPEGAKSSLFS
jgi:hypothetical protein